MRDVCTTLYNLLQLNHSSGIIFISETHINTEAFVNINLPSYTFLHSPSLSVVGRVGAYFSNQLKFVINNPLQLHVQGCKELWFNVTFPNLKPHYIFGAIYCHSHNHTHFSNALYETLQILNWKESNVIIMDININLLSDLDSPHLNHYNQIFASNGFTSFITNPTKITKLFQTSIDHIITNVNEAIITLGVLQYPISDHLPIFCTSLSVKLRTPYDSYMIAQNMIPNSNSTKISNLFLYPTFILIIW